MFLNQFDVVIIEWRSVRLTAVKPFKVNRHDDP